MQLFNKYILYICKRVKIIEDYMSNSFSVTANEKGWTVVKDGVTYTITDTNNNGRYDYNKDKIIFGDQSANPLSDEDKAEIKFSIMKADPEGMTGAGMAQYEKFIKTKEYQQKVEEEQARLQEERQAAQWAAQQPKKKGFWQKFATVLGFSAPILSGIGAGFIGAGTNSWQYNSCDSGLRWMSGISSGLMGFTTSFATMMPFIMGSQSKSLTSSLNLNSLLAQPAVPSTTNFDSLYNQFLTDINRTPSIEQQEQQEQRAQQARANYAEQIRKSYRDDELIPEANKQKLEEIAPPSKDSADYTEEDERILKQLAETPYVPIESIDIDGDQKGKLLSKEYAAKINNAIKEYNDAKVEDTPEFEHWKSNIEYLQKLISTNWINNWSYDSITKAIDEILNDPKKEQLTSTLTK